MNAFIEHRKTEKVDKWARKNFPERYPKTPDRSLLKGDDNGSEETDEE